MNILKHVGAVLLGVFVGMILITLMHMLGNLMYPLPEGLDMNDPEAMGAYIPTMPFGAMLMVLLAHGSGSFGGAFIAALLVRKTGKPMLLGWVVGGIVMVFGIMNLFMVPGHPMWFAIVDTVMYIPLGLMGAKLAIPKR